MIFTLFIHVHKFPFKPLCLHSITKILRNGPRAHFPFSEADDYMHKEKAKFRTLKELYKNLQISFEELNNCHNNLKESCEKLVEAQNSSHVHEAVLVTMDVGVTCDLLDSPTSEPHITNTICSKCNISLMN